MEGDRPPLKPWMVEMPSFVPWHVLASVVDAVIGSALSLCARISLQVEAGCLLIRQAARWQERVPVEQDGAPESEPVRMNLPPSASSVRYR